MHKIRDWDRITVRLEKEQLEWIGSFEEFRGNKSEAIRKCIDVAKRVYENADPEEFDKFVRPQVIKKK